MKSFVSCAPGGSPTNWKEILAREARRTKADVVLPVDQQAIKTLTANRDALPATAQLALMPSLGSLALADDKYAVALLLQELHLPLPHTIPVGRGPDFASALRAFPFPVLLKPTRSSGGRGIKEFATADTLFEHVQRGSLGESTHEVQEVVRGYDLSCNVLCEHGQIVSYSLQRGFLPASGPFQTPAGVEFVRHDDTMLSIRKVMAALEWNGVANIDMRFDEALILEINPRFWSSLLASASVGVNFAELACRKALRAELPTMGYRAGRFIMQRRPALRHLLRFWDRAGDRSTAPLRTILSYAAADPLRWRCRSHGSNGRLWGERHQGLHQVPGGREIWLQSS